MFYSSVVLYSMTLLFRHRPRGSGEIMVESEVLGWGLESLQVKSEFEYKNRAVTLGWEKQ
jgi:hypothetical protein